MNFSPVGKTPEGEYFMKSKALVISIIALVFAVISILIERFAYRPLRSAPRLNSLITAIAM